MKIHRKGSVFSGIALTVAAYAFATSAIANDSERSVVVHAGTLLAVPGDAPSERMSIIVSKGRIHEIQDGYVSPEAAGLPEARVIDLSDHFVMPGFMDLHVHLSGDRTSREPGEYVRRSESYISLRATKHARDTLMAGFTTVRDLGSRGGSIFALRDAIADGWVAGPKILVSGAAITPSAGHGDVHGYRREVLDALPAEGVCNGADDCRRAVRETIKRGADVIKVTATGGTGSQIAGGTGQQFTDAELAAIAETAHMFGRKVTAHAHGKEGIIAAIRAGFDNIEHAMWSDEETMEVFKDYGAWMVPTVWPITYAGETPEAMRNGPFRSAPPEVMDKLVELVANGPQPKIMTKLAYEMGVKIALGTDSGISPHGTNANEFIEYVDLGMSEMEALMTGTVHAAEAAGIEDAGRLAPGMAADIVAMPASPLEDIAAVKTVNFVMRDGIVFKQPQ